MDFGDPFYQLVGKAEPMTRAQRLREADALLEIANSWEEERILNRGCSRRTYLLAERCANGILGSLGPHKIHDSRSRAVPVGLLYSEVAALGFDLEAARLADDELVNEED
jgi:hypothetical protein